MGSGQRTHDGDGDDPSVPPVGRREVLWSSATVSAAATLSGRLTDETRRDNREPTVYVFNNGDRTLTVIDAEANEVLETVEIGTTASFPANQYGTGADSTYDILWLNVDGGVRALEATTLEEIAGVETGLGPNYPNLTPDERHLVIAAGGTLSLDPDPDDPEDHLLVRVDADPDSERFGEVTADLEVDYTGPCDVTLGPNGEYAYVADVAGETLSVVRVDPFEIVARIDAGEPVGEGDVLPFMCTASFDGGYLLVENGEGDLGPDPDVPREGSEGIWELSDPERPVELERITREDGLPALPITSEIGPDSEVAYLFTPDAEAVTVIDLEERAVDRVLDVGGSSISGAWGPHREHLYVPVQTEDRVAVIDHNEREVVSTLEAGDSPTGAVGGMVRPETGDLEGRETLTAPGQPVDGEATYCPDDHCYCQ
ncbi:YncE family protein [Natrialbaceae archaeon A-gly3]